MKKPLLQFAVCILLLVIGVPLLAADTKQVRIEWEAVKGAQGYIVEMKNQTGRTFYKKIVTPGYVVVKVGPGAYKIRITALNVFLKPGSNSGWTDLIVRIKEKRDEEPEGESTTQIGKLGKEQQIGPEEKNRVDEVERRKEEERIRAEERKKEEDRIKDAEQKKEEERIRKELARRRPEGHPRGLAGLGPLDIAAGGSFHVPVTGWRKYLPYAPGGHVALSYRLSGIDSIKNIPVLSSFGFALKFGVIPFAGHAKDKSSMTLLNMAPGAGIFYDFQLGMVKKWIFDLRLAFLVGPSFSQLEIKGLFPEKKRAVKLYYDPQVSFRFAYNGYFFMEVGCGFQSVLFSGQSLSSIYPFLQAGIRL